KYQQRQRVVSIMIAQCRAIADEDGLVFWNYILRSLEILTHHWMSDEETGYDEDNNEEPFKYVFDLDCRHPAFSSLFQHVDNTPALYPDFFCPTGAKRLKRVYTQLSVMRVPVNEIPSSFLR
ncbi:MAG: hypothetical protein NXY57DRAFT_865208, partial [Lentinula lateritia]